jgi:hypothetical protein
MRRRARCSALAAALAVFGAASALEIPEEYRAAVQSARQVGITLFIHDAAAWRATDELASRQVLQRDARLRGWLTDDGPDGKSIVVTFVGDDSGKPMGLHRVEVPQGDRKPVYTELKPATALDRSQLARWKARESALEALNARDDRCSEHYNTVVLPFDPIAGDLIRVYLLAATQRPRVMVVGGHFLFEFSVDGERLVNQRGFTRSCFEAPIPSESKSGKPVAFMLTHLLDPAPTELHVFLSRSHDMPINLMTVQNELLWLVSGREVELVESMRKGPQAGQ